MSILMVGQGSQQSLPARLIIISLPRAIGQAVMSNTGERSVSSTPLLQSLGWESLETRRYSGPCILRPDISDTTRIFSV